MPRQPQPNVCHRLTQPGSTDKQGSCITGPFGPIELPEVSDELDYELELGVVIGRRCRHVDAGEARAVIAGYLVVNDVWVRDWLQKRSRTFTLGKSFDTHGPIGPWVTTDDEMRDPLDRDRRPGSHREPGRAGSTAGPVGQEAVT